MGSNSTSLAAELIVSELCLNTRFCPNAPVATMVMMVRSHSLNRSIVFIVQRLLIKYSIRNDAKDDADDGSHYDKENSVGA